MLIGFADIRLETLSSNTFWNMALKFNVLLLLPSCFPQLAVLQTIEWAVMSCSEHWRVAQCMIVKSWSVLWQEVQVKEAGWHAGNMEAMS